MLHWCAEIGGPINGMGRTAVGHSTGHFLVDSHGLLKVIFAVVFAVVITVVEDGGFGIGDSHVERHGLSEGDERHVGA